MHKSNNILFGKVCHHLKEVDSTNVYAKMLLSTAKSKPFDGTAIITDDQTAGRGQFGNSWLVQPGKNLTFSVILYPKFVQPAYQFQLNVAISLGIYACLAQLLPQEMVQIKWPNDILLNGKKVAGILIECGLSGSSISYAVVGIGLNVNQQDFGELQDRATSLALTAGINFDKNEVLQKLFTAMEKEYFALRRGEFRQLKDRYLQALYGLGQPLPFQAENKTFTGTIQDTDPQGLLLVKHSDDGQTRAYGFKQISFLGTSGS